MANTHRRPVKYQTLTEVYLTWANFHLARRHLKVNKIQHDFCDGMLLCHLIELTSNHQLLHKVQQTQSVMLQINNVSMLLEFMKNCGIKLAIKPEDIVKGDIKSILSMLWAIFIHFDVHRNDPAAYLRTTAQAMKKLTQWCRNQLNLTDNFDFKRTPFAKCFQDGKLLTEIIKKHCQLPSTGFHSYNDSPNDKLRHFTAMIETAESQLRLPSNLIRPSDILQGKADEHILLIFLALLKHQIEDSELAKERRLKESLTDFTTVKMDKSPVSSEALLTQHQRIHFYKDSRLETYEKLNQDNYNPYVEYPQESNQFIKPSIYSKANSSLPQTNGQPDTQSSNLLVTNPNSDFHDNTITSTKQDIKIATSKTISVPHDVHHGSRYLIENESRKVQQELDELEKRLMASKERFSQTDSVTELLTSPHEVDVEFNSRKQDSNPQNPSVNIHQQLSSTAIIQNNTSNEHDKAQSSITVQRDHQAKVDAQYRFDKLQIELNQLKEEKEYWVTNQLQSQQQIQELTQQLEREKEIQLELGKQNFLLKEKIIQLEESLQRHLQGIQDRQQQDLQVDKMREDWQLMKKNKAYYEDQIQQLVKENTILQAKLNDFNVVKQELITIQQDFKATVTEKMSSLQTENDQLREALYEIESLRHEGIQFKVKLDQILQENDQLHQQLNHAEQVQSHVSEIKDELRDRFEIENGQIHQMKQQTIDDQNHSDNLADGQQPSVATTVSPYLNHPSTRVPFDTSSPSRGNNGSSCNTSVPNESLNQTLDADLSALSKESTKLKEIETRLDDLRRENKLLSGSLRDTEVALNSLTTSFNADDHPKDDVTSSPLPTTTSAPAATLKLLEQQDPVLSLSKSAAKVKESQVNSEESRDEHTRLATTEPLPSHLHLNPFLSASISDHSHHNNHNDTHNANTIESGITANDKRSERETSIEFISSQNSNPFLHTDDHYHHPFKNNTGNVDYVKKDEHPADPMANQNNKLATATDPSLDSKSRVNYDSGAFSATFPDSQHHQFSSNHRVNTNVNMNKSNKHLYRSDDGNNEYNNQDVAMMRHQVNHNFPSSSMLDRDYRLTQIPGNDQQPTKQKATIVTTTTTASSGSYDRDDTIKSPFRMEIKVQKEKSNGDLHGGSYTSSFNNDNISSRVSVFSEDSYMEFAATTRNQAKANHGIFNHTRYPSSSQHQSKTHDDTGGNYRSINSPFKYDLSMLVHDQS